MPELTLSERLRVAAAVDGHLTLELTNRQAAELIRICANMEANGRTHDAMTSRFNAITARHEWNCRINEMAIRPLSWWVLALSAMAIVKFLIN